MKILIMTPSARDPKWGYIRSVEAMEAYVRTHGIGGEPVEHLERIVETQCSLLPQGRQRLLFTGMREEFDYGVMIDDDMEFPHNILDIMFPHLLKSLHVKPLYALGINYARKDPGALGFTAVGLDGKMIDGLGYDSGVTPSSVTPVRDCGLGFMIANLQAIAARVPYPHFEILWSREESGYIGEDRYFTRKLNAHGIGVCIDNVASGLVSHIGDFPYSQVTMRHARLK